MRRANADQGVLPAALLREAGGWAQAWGVPALLEAVTIQFSGRLRATLGRCIPGTGRIVLHPSLQDDSGDRLREVLCHELAHVAAYQLYGSVARAHGPEWAALVRAAGFEPRLYLGASGERHASATTPSRFEFLHACPVCQTRRFARRPVRRWRCAECVAAGLPGELQVTRLKGAE